MRIAFTRNRVIGLIVAGVIALIDFAVKFYLTEVIDLRATGTIDLLPFFNLTYTENRGISLGMLQATNTEMRWLLLALTAGIATIVLVWMMREKLLGDILALALILGGALGNIRDRWDLGYVIDYADFRIRLGETMVRPFMVFNIADAAITIGVVVILARSLFMRESKTEPDEADAA
jgi:signal peptidase II